MTRRVKLTSSWFEQESKNKYKKATATTMTRTVFIALIVVLGIARPLWQGAHAFAPTTCSSSSSSRPRTPRAVLGATASPNHYHDMSSDKRIQCRAGVERTLQTSSAAALLALVLSTAPALAVADTASFANQDISGQDFSGQDLSGRDFTNVVARKTVFHNCNLQGSTFNKAILENTDFSGANVKQATFLDATLDGASFKNAVAERAIFSATILDVGDLENVDLTDSLWPSKLRIMICDMPEIKGANPVTGVDSKDSIMCTDIAYYK